MALNRRSTFIALVASSLLAACGGGSDSGSDNSANDSVVAGPADKRPQDSRTFSTASIPPFTALDPAAGDSVDVTATSRWSGELGGAGYRVEVPANWNGKLVMYAHGFAGDGPALVITNPAIRRHLIEQGYAWAASSYSKNYYDVRAGVEDTNALALAFNSIAAANGRTLSPPSKIYITGHSMGGHVAAAAVEQETLATAVHRVRYDGAVPMCGVVGDMELFKTFGAMKLAAQALTGFTNSPIDAWPNFANSVTPQLFSQFPDGSGSSTTITPTPLGMRYLSIVKNLTGGDRPMFTQGWAFGGSFASTWNIAFHSDSTINGILSLRGMDTYGVKYVIDGDPTASDSLNDRVQRLRADAGANALRPDGLRWVPLVNGQFDVPVVSIHTLGDLFVPFSMQQVYARRAASHGNSSHLVQRAMRGASHCDLTVAEQTEAFDDMVAWETTGSRPPGDVVLDPAVVAAPDYGCQFTRDTLGPDDGAGVRALRAAIAQSGGSCPS